jgi:2-polyprenyl-6-hydroxyphenyl methylase/3-demethylubiquinone-9 3-methyltransferase
MIAEHEAIVASRFDALRGRFKTQVPADDPRLGALVAALAPLEGRHLLDLGCGKGRFSCRLRERGARTVGLDISRAMLAEASGLERVRASARRLPFGEATFDRVIAVEVFQHLAPRALDAVCREVRRILRPGGKFVIVDKNVCSWNAARPWLPNAAVKWIDERRGRWMYSHRGPVRERWFRPRQLQRRLSHWFGDVHVVHLLSRSEEGRFPFHWVPSARQFTLWAARAPGGCS